MYIFLGANIFLCPFAHIFAAQTQKSKGKRLFFLLYMCVSLNKC